MPIGKVWIYRLLFVCFFCVFVCTDTYFSAEDKASGVTFCSAVHNNNNNNIHICIAPYGRNFRGAGPGSVLVGVRRGKRVSLGEEKCL